MIYGIDKAQMNKVKSMIANKGAQAWAIYDYECTNPILQKLIGKVHLSRKSIVFITPNKNDFVICHVIDQPFYEKIAPNYGWQVRPYKNWQGFLARLSELEFDKILMEMSDDGLLPRSSYVDYGTICLMKKYVKIVDSSADIYQILTASIDQDELKKHLIATNLVNKVKDNAFAYIGEQIRTYGKVSEYAVQQHIMKDFADNNLTTDSAPIVARNANASNCHYCPTAEETDFITKGDLVLIDLWAKYGADKGVFADITWIGYVGDVVPSKMQKIYDIVSEAVDTTVEFLTNTIPQKVVYGYEVDDVCRAVIEKYGYGEYYVHRTGHSISVDDTPHGVGVNIDNYETHDYRSLINGVAFSIEPGIYLPEFGVRKEINVFIDNGKALVTTPRQKDIILIKA